MTYLSPKQRINEGKDYNEITHVAVCECLSMTSPEDA